MQSIGQLIKFRWVLLWFRHLYFTKIWGMDIAPDAQISLSAKLDKIFPSGIHIGARTLVAFDVAILTHDFTRGVYAHTRIGQRCFIGARSLILPGVTIGDESIVAAGSVVTRDVPPRTIVAGNPARVIRDQIEVIGYGRLKEANETEAQCRAETNYHYRA